MIPAVQTHTLKKSFPTKKGRFEAVKGIDLTIYKGEIFGFLGPNGAGKTTTLRMLATLLNPDSGQAMVAGFDVSAAPHEVRRRIGYVSQAGGSDRQATGRENLLLQGQLYGMSSWEAKERAKEIIDIFSLGECADRLLSIYSGGQKRRLDIGLGIMQRPEVLFLDEPSIGLDPQNRTNLWDQIRQLREQGAAIFLTSHYLEEIDILSDRLAIIDYGLIVAEDTPQKLKKQISEDVVKIRLKERTGVDTEILHFFHKSFPASAITHAEDGLCFHVGDGEAAIPNILQLLHSQKIELQTISLSRPTLNDVFLKKTGRSLKDI